jgi:hypothetical protein
LILLESILSIPIYLPPSSKSIKGTFATVKFAFGSAPVGKDVIVNIQVSQPHEPRVCIEEYDGSTAAMVSLFPHIQLCDVPVEIIFLLDRSESMAGSKIDAVKASLQLFLCALPDNCYFNIIGFGSKYECLFPHSMKYEDSSAREATEYIKKMEPDLGGTEMLESLQHIFQQPLMEGYPRQVSLSFHSKFYFFHLKIPISFHFIQLSCPFRCSSSPTGR